LRAKKKFKSKNLKNPLNFYAFHALAGIENSSPGQQWQKV